MPRSSSSTSKGSTEFTIQEVVDRSKQSLRGFYEYFDGKDELVLALFEETRARGGRRHPCDRRRRVGPAPRLRAFTIRSTSGATRARNHGSGAHTTAVRSPSSRCTSRPTTPTGCAPRSRRSRVCCASSSTAQPTRARSTSSDARRATALVQQTVMYSWFGNRLVANPQHRLDAEETWEFCLHGLRG